MRHLLLASLLTTAVLAACTGADDEQIDDAVVGSEEGIREREPLGHDGGGAGAPKAPRTLPRLSALTERCKLINGRNQDDPTPNRTHLRANLRGTDLGIPVAHGDDLYFFFGDSVGYRGIWPLGPTSHPDAVASLSLAATRNDPKAACSDLRFLLTTDALAIGPRRDPAIEGDFAGVSMIPPAGRSIGEFVRNPSGTFPFSSYPALPGDFEVPTGAFSYGGAIYVFYSSVVSRSVAEMKGSYLARWSSPSPTGQPAYDILYDIDQRRDAFGPLRGDFINIAPVVVGDMLYLFGTGAFRKSDVHLARKPLATLAQPGGFERFDAATGQWGSPTSVSAAPIVRSGGIGELSVRYFASIDRFVMMNQEIRPGDNQIVVRVADTVTGPWSEPITVASFTDAAFLSKYCCVDGDCSGERLFNCGKGAFYGAFMLPEIGLGGDGSFSIDFTMSTWDPYNVALMSASFW